MSVYLLIELLHYELLPFYFIQLGHYTDFLKIVCREGEEIFVIEMGGPDQMSLKTTAHANM